MGLLSWLLGKKKGPEIVELANISAEHAYIARLKCPKCGRKNDAQRTGSGSAPNHRTHDYWTISCPRCKTSRPLILSVPAGAGLQQILAQAGDQMSPEKQEALSRLGALLSGERPMPKPVARKKLAPDADLFEQYTDDVDALYNDDLKKILSSSLDDATKRKQAYQAEDQRNERMQLALATLNILANESLPQQKRLDAQMNFNLQHAIALSLERHRRGLDG